MIFLIDGLSCLLANRAHFLQDLRFHYFLGDYIFLPILRLYTCLWSSCLLLPKHLYGKQEIANCSEDLFSLLVYMLPVNWEADIFRTSIWDGRYLQVTSRHWLFSAQENQKTVIKENCLYTA